MTIALLVTVNVVWVGMGETSPFKLFFDNADQVRLARYVSPYLVLFLEEAAAESVGRPVGHAYFYVDLAFDPATSAKESSSIMGCLAYNRLFEPKILRRHIRVVWREGDALLLATVRAVPQGTPVPGEFIQRWPGKLDKRQYSLGQMKELCGRIAGYYAVAAVDVDRPASSAGRVTMIHGWSAYAADADGRHLAELGSRERSGL